MPLDRAERIALTTHMAVFTSGFREALNACGVDDTTRNLFFNADEEPTDLLCRTALPFAKEGVVMMVRAHNAPHAENPFREEADARDEAN